MIITRIILTMTKIMIRNVIMILIMLTKVLQGETFVFPMWRGQVKGFVRNDDDTAADDDYDHENHDNDDVCGALE